MMVYKNAVVNGVKTDFTVKDGRFDYIGKCDADGIDLCGKRVYSGLVDIHSHGCMGHDTMDASGFAEMSLYQAKNGVTSWYPTTMTMDKERLLKVSNCDVSDVPGAQILGWHFVGPYISEKYRGAQNAKYIRNADAEEFSEYKNVKLVTVAPETDGCLGFIKKCGAVVCIGHTDADYDTAVKAFDCGAKCLTHVFNAMPPLHHRRPGVIGAAIEKDAYVQVICDGYHIHKSVIIALYRIFGSERMILISDSMRATGMPDGVYEFGGQQITVEEGAAKTPDGKIAGSTSDLLKCVKTAIGFGIPADDAFKMASATPAKLMGIKKGEINSGYDADFIVTDDDFCLHQVVIGGRII